MTPRSTPSRVAAASALLLGSCAPKPFAIVGCDLGPAEGAKLNQPLVVSFNDEIDPGGVRPGTIRVVRSRDGAEVAGSLCADGATVTFRPRLPILADLSDSALQPGESYSIEVRGLPILRSLRGLARGALCDGMKASFRAISVTPDRLASAPAAELFVDPVPGAPELSDDPSSLPHLGKDDKARLQFSEPLDPRSVARARFRLHGPWSNSAHLVEIPVMKATLLDNELQPGDRACAQPRSLVELELTGPPPSPISARETYMIELEEDVLRDFAGLAVAREGRPQKFLTLQVDR